jgi:uncharacterized protein
MLIAVISDTHRIDKYIKLGSEAAKDADILIHLGDNVEDVEYIEKNFKGEVYAVKGNCDYSTTYPNERIIEVEGKRIFFTHGHLYGVKNGMNNIYYRGRELDVDVVLFGHTHTACIERTDSLTLMNPGSISLPRLTKRGIGFIDIKENGEIEAYLKTVEE